ncbi:MAG: hypothetical protein RJA22_2547 [Verrucomicrobiota bacterium]
MQPSRRLPLAAALAATLAGCAVGPDYQRPAVDAPPDFHRSAAEPRPAPGTRPATNSFGNLGWWETFQDPQLLAYLGEALTNNWDLRIATARVLQAEAAARIVRSQFLPTVSAGGDLVTARASQRGPTPIPPGADPTAEYGDAFLALPAYEVDLWGRLRRANEAARAQLLATRDAENTVRQTLVATVATAYLNLLELDLELDIANRTLAVRTNSLSLTQARADGGLSSMADVYQARILVDGAEAAISETHRRIEQQETLLSTLLGRNPGPLQRGPGLLRQQLPASVPAGLPSDLLQRRPDLRAAEQQLVAANADIGQARAAFYPQLTLTGVAGFQSVALSDLFSSPAKTWQFGPAVTLPLFTGGRLRGNLQLAQARFQEALAAYRQSVQQAFREVSDGLIAYQRSQEFRAKQETRTLAHREATELASVRYQGGVTSYLEVLYNEQELFESELRLAQARRNELLSVIQVYRALGGGWTSPTPAAPTRPAP